MVSLRVVPLLVAVIPFAGIYVTYWIATSNDLVPACMPLIDGCTSISAVGRYEPASFLFRAIQLPLASLLFVTWLLSIQWLKGMHHDGKTQHRVILIAGTIGALALIVYVTFLGTKQPFYEFMRRFGIYFYFLGTAIAQLTLALAVAKIEPKTVRFEGVRQSTVLLWLAALPFALGIANLIFKSILDDPDAMENRIEWIAATVMQLYYLYLWLAWRATGFVAVVRTDVFPPR